MAILKRENKNTDFFRILAWLCRFNYCVLLGQRQLSIGSTPHVGWAIAVMHAEVYHY